MAEASSADTSRIHNFDQRAPVVELKHEALPHGRIRLEQRGATTEGFVPGTSSVAWPVATRMARYLCEHKDIVSGRSAVELGAGLGIVGAVAAALGATPVVVTDCEGAMPLLQRNGNLLHEDGVEVAVAQLEWGNDEQSAALLKSSSQKDGFHLVLGSDIVIAGFDTDKLFQSIMALLSKQKDAMVLLGYEFREEWETIGTLIGWLEDAGLTCSHIALIEDPTQPEESDEDCDMLLYTLTWKPSQ
mmetsp:Transcript_17047/g.30781  ORF Transcript_17047/g.30781 Transcript_17047/m.30781 type:complete len:245 (+) Transcript_17047:121-855(+)